MFFSRPKVIIRKREDHPVSRQNIDPDALRVLYRLSHAGFVAYLVGGGVRDLLMGRKPKDFDISTDAHPAQIRKLFHNCFLIGRRFRLAHIIFGRKVIETSTFRKQPAAAEADEGVPGGLYQHEDNTFGTPEEDARRRDFTVNGLFYDIRTFSVIDYVGGLRDLEHRTLRVIGDPNIRFREDPVRMMRAVRFAARLGFTMDWSCRRAIRRHFAEIGQATTPRLLEEIMRLFGHGCAAQAFKLLWEYRLMSVLLPDVHAFVEKSGGSSSPLWRYLDAFDHDSINAEASNGLRLALLYAPIYQARMDHVIAAEEQMRPSSGQVLAQEILEPIVARMKVPRQGFYTACALLQAQHRLEEPQRRGRRARFSQRDMLVEVVALRRMILVATGRDPSVLHDWEEEAAQQREPAAAAEERTAGASHAPDEHAAPSLEQDEDESAPGRHRRRRRRRRRSHADGHPGEASQPKQNGGPAADSVAPGSRQPQKARPPSDSDANRPADAG